MLSKMRDLLQREGLATVLSLAKRGIYARKDMKRMENKEIFGIKICQMGHGFFI